MKKEKLKLLLKFTYMKSGQKGIDRLRRQTKIWLREKGFKNISKIMKDFDKAVNEIIGGE